MAEHITAGGETASAALVVDRSCGPTRLQEVLPEIRSLAMRVGGLRRLAEIVACLAENEE
jgi:hypothetical protein